MGAIILMGLLFGGTAFFTTYCFYEKTNKTAKSSKWACGTLSAVLGLFVGLAISSSVGEMVAGKYLEKNQIRIIEKDTLEPFQPYSCCGYMIIGENNGGEKVVWYLQNGMLFEEDYDERVDKRNIIFSNDEFANKQLIRPNVGVFWRFFAIIPLKRRFVVPPGGLQKGQVVKTYNFVPE